MSAVPLSEIVESFATELAGVVGALAEAAVTVEAGTTRPDGGFRITMVADEGGEGVLFAQFDRSAAQELARLALGAGDDCPESDIVDGLRDMCGQAIATVIERRKMDGVRVIVQSVNTVTEPADGQAVVKVIRTAGATTQAGFALWGTLVLGIVAPAVTAATAPPLAPSRPAQHAKESGPGPAGPNLDAILDLELPLIVRFGRAELTLKDLAMLAPGAVIDLGRSPDDPVEVLVSNQVVARGEVVTVSGNYGVRITDVVGTADRIRHMEIAS
jgi:flagellar motor switch protein FliN/FliY